MLLMPANVQAPTCRARVCVCLCVSFVLSMRYSFFCRYCRFFQPNLFIENNDWIILSGVFFSDGFSYLTAACANKSRNSIRPMLICALASKGICSRYNWTKFQLWRVSNEHSNKRTDIGIPRASMKTIVQLIFAKFLRTPLIRIIHIQFYSSRQILLVSFHLARCHTICLGLNYLIITSYIFSHHFYHKPLLLKHINSQYENKTRFAQTIFLFAVQIILRQGLLPFLLYASNEVVHQISPYAPTHMQSNEIQPDLHTYTYTY